MQVSKEGVGKYPKAPDIADLTVGELIKRLRPSALYTIIATSLSIFSAALVVGWQANTHIGNATTVVRIDAVAATKEGNRFQQELRSRAELAMFSRFLDAVATERWADAFALTSSNWRNYHKTSKPSDLAREFRMTQRHELHYFIPREVAADVAVYDIDFEYWDFIPRLPHLEVLSNGRIGQSLKPDRVAELTEELISELPRHYDTSKLAPADLRTYVTSFVENLTLRDYVLRDDLFEELGGIHHLKLRPIVIKDMYQGARPAVQKRRFVKARLVKEEGVWKVHSYDSFMVEKR